MAGLTYAYDTAGRLASATYPDGTVVAYGAAAPSPVAPAPLAPPRYSTGIEGAGPGVARADAVPVAPPAPAPAARPPAFCVRCGAKLTPGAAFCVKCGAKVG